MPIAKSKSELLRDLEAEYRLLKRCLDGIGADRFDSPGV